MGPQTSGPPGGSAGPQASSTGGYGVAAAGGFAPRLPLAGGWAKPDEEDQLRTTPDGGIAAKS